MKRTVKYLISAAVGALCALGRFMLEPVKSYAESQFVFYALTQTDTDKGIKPMPICDGNEVVAVREVVSLAANPGVGDILAMLEIPADHVPVDCILDADDLDANAGPTITLDVGVLNAAKTDIDVTAASGGGKWITASAVAQAGGLARPTDKYISRVTPDSSSNRSVGVRVAAASATFQAGDIGLTLLLRPARYGV